jgi:hypothetical protein
MRQAWTLFLVVLHLALGLALAGTAAAQTKVWQEGSAYGPSPEEALREAAVDAVMSLLVREIKGGALATGVEERVRREIAANVNAYVAGTRPKRATKDAFGHNVTADFQLKVEKVRVLAREIVSGSMAGDGRVLPPILFIGPPSELRSAFGQAFREKGLTVRYREAALERFEAERRKWAQLTPEQREVEHVMSVMRQARGEEIVPANDAALLGRFMDTPFVLDGRFEASTLPPDAFGRAVVLVTLKGFNLYEARTADTLATIQDSVRADGANEAEARAKAMKKAADVLSRHVFEQIVQGLPP